MTFKPEFIEEFKALFNSKKELIAAMEGCSHVELLQDVDNRAVFFTYSLWAGPQYLEAYRNSELFKEVWAKTKVLFDAKPEAWSTETVSASK
jgi:heme-degrading monooxygenase HmoA